MTGPKDRRGDVTALLLDLKKGKRDAFDALVPLVYEELRVMARHHLRKKGGNVTLNTTGLVHDAYVRLVDRTQLAWEDRSHFLAVFSTVMRNLVVDYARAKGSKKRGGDRVRVTLAETAATVEAHADQILAVNDVMARLQAMDERMARVVECRYFAGLTEPETAEALGTSERTVRRDWVKAKLVLSNLMND